MYRVSFGNDENVLKLLVVMVAQLCEHPKNHQIVHFKWVNCVVYDYISVKLLAKKKKKSYVKEVGKRNGISRLQDMKLHAASAELRDLGGEWGTRSGMCGG